MAHRSLKSTELIKFKALYEPVFSEIIRSHEKIPREFLFFFIRAFRFFHIDPKSIKTLIRKIEQIQAEISLAENIQDSRPLMVSCAI